METNNAIFSVDLETGGFDSKKDIIIEFGLAVIDNLKIKEKIGSLIRPYGEYKKEALSYSNIVEKDLKRSDFTIQDFVNLLIEYSNQYNTGNKKRGKPILAGHNIFNFDLLFLEKVFEKVNENIWDYFDKFCLLDTLQLSNVIFWNMNQLKDKKLGTVAIFLDIDSGKAHRAVDDAVTTAKILIKYIKYYSETFDKFKMMQIKC